MSSFVIWHCLNLSMPTTIIYFGVLTIVTSQSNEDNSFLLLSIFTKVNYCDTFDVILCKVVISSDWANWQYFYSNDDITFSTVNRLDYFWIKKTNTLDECFLFEWYFFHIFIQISSLFKNDFEPKFKTHSNLTSSFCPTSNVNYNHRYVHTRREEVWLRGGIKTARIFLKTSILKSYSTHETA